MLRVLTSMIRNAPGPFRGARALTADFIDGLIDVVSPPVDTEQPPPPPSTERVERHSVKSVDSTPSPSTKSEAAPRDASAATESKEDDLESAPDDEDLGDALKAALARSEWMRKQDFKVMAIFWEAKRRDLGALTAKHASKLGDEIGVTIRHENIRKVVRTRLVDHIETTTVPESQPPTFQYELTDSGKSFFQKEYLSKL